MFNDEPSVQGDQNVQVPAHLNFGKFMLDRLRRMKNEVALENAETGETLSYKELTQHAVDLSVSLTQLGICQGDVIGVGSEKRITWLPIELAVILSGATYTSFYVKVGRAVLRHCLNICQPKIFMCSKLFWEAYGDVLESIESIKTFITLDDCPVSGISLESLTSNHYDVERFEPVTVKGQVDTALILYSSGTTGMSKGIQLTHLNCILNSLADDFYKNTPLKTIFVCGEWYHGYDIFMSFKFISIGRKLVYVDEVTRDSMLKCFEKYQVNIAMLNPCLVNILAKTDENDKFALDSLQFLYSRCAPLHVKTMEMVKQRFPSINNILQGYGMTEAGELTSENWGLKGPKQGSVGGASPGITLKVVDTETQEVLGPNQNGEIRLKGPVFMKGYIGIDESEYLDENGFFKTGDLGYYDDDGYFYIVDRIKELFKYDASKVAPLELETLLQTHPDVLEAGVVGKPVPIYGEAATAFVVRHPGSKVTEQELINYVAPEVPPFMQLHGGVIFISQIPRNPRGKILRRKLREMLNDTL